MLLGVDVGGTFTDAVLVDDEGVAFTAKVPSTPTDWRSERSPIGQQHVGVLRAVEEVLELAQAGPELVRRFAHGMTVATNALLEERVARTALVATEGFTDIVELGRQARPSLYRLCEQGPRPLAPPELRFAAPERMGPGGPWRALDCEAVATLLEQLAAAEPEAIAVVLLHSYAHPEHERRLGELISSRLPKAHLSLSHELVGTFREYERAATTEIDAALSPLLSAYLAQLRSETRRRGLVEPRVMQSSGGLADASEASRHAALTVLSGPAGGVGGALMLSEMADERDLLCFDMGGTSCDVCVIEEGNVAETAERAVAGRPLALAALDIHTVGAGGGSIAWRDEGGALRVGPQSAGAVPGPACYGRGGERPTVTDANLVLGRLLADAPLAGGVSLDRRAAERAIRKLASALGLEEIACAEGIVRVAETEMLRALRVMTVQRGIDPRRFALMPFGGAGPLHAASMASELGIERVLCPRACGVLCALGLAAAAPRQDAASTVMLSGDTLTEERLRAETERLLERARGRLGGPLESVRVRCETRYSGQSFELAVPAELESLDPARLRAAFEEIHEERYGYRDAQARVELVNVRVSAIGPRPPIRLAGISARGAQQSATRVVFEGRELDAELWRGELAPGARIGGPALCALPEATLLVPPGWSGEVDERGTIALERSA